MKILLVNKFFFPKGGAENVVFDTTKLLEKHGHEVIPFAMEHPLNLPSYYRRYFVSQVDYNSASFSDKLESGLRILYSWEARHKIEELLRSKKPDLVHLNNIYHQISPSILHSFRKLKIPVVMTLHDYKLVCASYSLLNNGKICEACTNEKFYRCFLTGCVKQSRAKSLLSMLEMYLHHNLFNIYDLVDCFISPSAFLKTKIEEMGFKGKILNLPNFIDTKSFKPSYSWVENSICYFGRLSPEKGLVTLLEAMKNLNYLTLKIIGDGPMKSVLENKVREENLRNVHFLGYKTGEVLKEEVGRSMFVVMPSECYENNPRSVIEGFALGKPVIGARIGGIPELVRDGHNGFLFEAGNPFDLRAKIVDLCRFPERIEEMGQNARLFIEEEMNEELHYQKLMQIYEETFMNYWTLNSKSLGRIHV